MTYSESGETTAADPWEDNEALEEEWEEAGFGSEGGDDEDLEDDEEEEEEEVEEDET